MSEKMTDGELNERLAKALGHFEMRQCPDDHLGFGMVEKEVLVLNSGAVLWPWDFSPATDSNHLREYVLPEIERRGLWDELAAELALPWLHDAPDMRWEAFVLTASPAVLAAAALKVLRGEG